VPRQTCGRYGFVDADVFVEVALKEFDDGADDRIGGHEAVAAGAGLDAARRNQQRLGRRFFAAHQTV